MWNEVWQAAALTFDWRGLLGNENPVIPLSCLDAPPELFVVP